MSWVQSPPLCLTWEYTCSTKHVLNTWCESVQRCAYLHGHCISPHWTSALCDTMAGPPEIHIYLLIVFWFDLPHMKGVIIITLAEASMFKILVANTHINVWQIGDHDDLLLWHVTYSYHCSCIEHCICHIRVQRQCRKQTVRYKVIICIIMCYTYHTTFNSSNTSL